MSLKFQKLIRFIGCSSLIFLSPIYSSENFSEELSSSKEYIWIQEYLSSAESTELIKKTADFLTYIHSSFENSGYAIIKMSHICEELQVQFPNRPIIEEIRREIVLNEGQFCCLLKIKNKKEDEEEESSKHLEKAVEGYLWGTAEIAIGVAETVRGDPLGGALIIGDGIRNCKEAWNELQEAIAEKNKKDEEDK